MEQPLVLEHPNYIHIGSGTFIRAGVRMEAVFAYPERKPSLWIGNNVTIEQNVHLICHSRISIGNNVTITGNCAIVDVTHPYQDMVSDIKVGNRILDEDSFVEIGDGTFLGFGAIIMPNVRIGKRCVIGAHAVVTKSVPDYCVVAGNPAGIIRHYNPETCVWNPVTK